MGSGIKIAKKSAIVDGSGIKNAGKSEIDGGCLAADLDLTTATSSFAIL
jgi:hypothetical protein